MIRLITTTILIAIRIPLLIILISAGLLTILFFPSEIKKFKNVHYKIMMLWMNFLSNVLGLSLIIKGRPDMTADLFVSNHVTYVDIIIINKLLPVNFIAKDEIANWPIIGRLASKTGTLFIKRGDINKSQNMITIMRERFKLKNKIIFFPEGKIGNGSFVKKFHTKLFKSIENTNLTIQPIAIRYPKNFPDDLSYDEQVSEKSIDGDMISLYFSIMSKPKSHVILNFLDKIDARDSDISEVSSVLATKINSSLRELDD